MNGEGSQSDRDGTVKVDDNVIRLTDWLGPREELIPFGPGADAEQANHVPTAADFWSESSGAVQDALTAPHSEAAGKPSRSTSRRRGRATAAAIWSQRRAALRPADWVPPRLGQRRGRAVAAAGLAVTVVLVLIASLSTAGSPTFHPGGHLTASRGHTASAASDLARARRTTPSVLTRRPRAHSTASSHARRVPGGRQPTVRRGLRRRPPASTLGTQPVGYATPVASSPTNSAPSQSATAPGPAPSTSTPAAATPSGQGGTSASQSALGASGSLAPGSSPDG